MLVSVIGCTASYQQSALTQPTVKLAANEFVYVATPENGWYGDQEYRNSGVMAANATRAAFAKYSSSTKIIDSCAGEECFTELEGSTGYLVMPVILHWEDRATEWSGKSDRLEIQVTVYDLATQEELASSVLKGKSKWATMGGDHPQDLLPDSLNNYVKTLY